MVVQTGRISLLSDALLRERQSAGAGLIHLLYYIKQRIHRADVAERTVIGAEFLVYHSCLEYPRIILLRYNDRRVGLAVLEQNVVFGLVFLY